MPEKLQEEIKTKRMNFALPEELYDQLYYESVERRVKMAVIIRESLMLYFAQKEKETPKK